MSKVDSCDFRKNRLLPSPSTSYTAETNCADVLAQAKQLEFWLTNSFTLVIRDPRTDRSLGDVSQTTAPPG